MITKQVVLDSLKQLPDEFKLDTLMEKLFLLEKIEQSREQSRKGEVISHEDLKEEINKW